jgi:hypothetical protein
MFDALPCLANCPTKAPVVHFDGLLTFVITVRQTEMVLLQLSSSPVERAQPGILHIFSPLAHPRL